MGFMGINHWGESDNAAGFKFNLDEAVAAKRSKVPLKARVQRLVDKELKDMANDFNTPGFLNLALLLEVEGSGGDYIDQPVPVFSNLLKLSQLKTCSKMLGECKWPEERPRLIELKRLVDKLIRTRQVRTRCRSVKH